MGLPVAVITTQNDLVGPFVTENTFEFCVEAAIVGQLRELVMVAAAAQL